MGSCFAGATAPISLHCRFLQPAGLSTSGHLLTLEPMSRCLHSANQKWVPMSQCLHSANKKWVVLVVTAYYILVSDHKCIQPHRSQHSLSPAPSHSSQIYHESIQPVERELVICITQSRARTHTHTHTHTHRIKSDHKWIDPVRSGQWSEPLPNTACTCKSRTGSQLMWLLVASYINRRSNLLVTRNYLFTTNVCPHKKVCTSRRKVTP